MSETRIAKLFKNGASQAVRLPAEFRFDGDRVFVTRDDQTGDLLLSTKPGTQVWSQFFEFARSIESAPDFMVERPMNAIPAERGVFDDDA